MYFQSMSGKVLETKDTFVKQNTPTLMLAMLSMYWVPYNILDAYVIWGKRSRKGLIWEVNDE